MTEETTRQRVTVRVRLCDDRFMGCQVFPDGTSPFVLVRLTEELELYVDHPATVASLAGVLSEAYSSLQRLDAWAEYRAARRQIRDAARAAVAQ